MEIGKIRKQELQIHFKQVISELSVQIEFVKTNSVLHSIEIDDLRIFCKSNRKTKQNQDDDKGDL